MCVFVADAHKECRVGSSGRTPDPRTTSFSYPLNPAARTSAGARLSARVSRQLLGNNTPSKAHISASTLKKTQLDKKMGSDSVTGWDLFMCV